MRWIYKLPLRLRSLFRQGRVEQELTDELRVHLENLVQQNLAEGLSPEQARYKALRELAGVEQIKELCRDMRQVNYIETLTQDLRHGLRILIKSPGFSAVAVLTLALGIASTTILFSILDGAYFHFPGPQNGHGFVVLTQQFTKREAQTARFSPAEYFDIASLHRSFDGFFALDHWIPTLTEATERGRNPERVPVVRITANMFSLYVTPPILGRVFTAEEDRPGGPNVAVVTYRLWNRRFGRDAAIVGRTIKLDGDPYSVIGVMPRGFQEWGADIYLPLRLGRASANRSERNLTIAGVMNKGLSAVETLPALRDLARRVEAQYAATYPEYNGLIYVPWDVREGVVGDLRIALYVLLGAVAMLLVITAANIASLLLARTRARAREIGTRLALGATPARLARQFMTESALLSAAAGLLGFLIGFSGLGPVMALIPEHFIGEGSDMHVSFAAFLISLSAALTLGLGFGMAPAILISRRGVAGNLGQTRTGADASRGSGRVRALLVLGEMALAFIVVTSAGLMVRTYLQLTSADLGFQPDNVLTLRIALAESRYPGNAQITNFFRELLLRVRRLPGVVGVAASSIRPMEGAASRSFSIPGRSLNTPGGIATADYRVITPEYFAVLRTPVRKGRSFGDEDGPHAPAVAMVNERFAQTYFPNENAVGKQIRLENGYSARIAPIETPENGVVEIVGVVKDSRQLSQWSAMRDLEEPASPEIFVPLLQHPETARDMALLLRTQTEPGALSEAVRQQVLRLNADQPVYDIETLRAMADLSLGPARLCLLLLGVFAGVALVTACVGLYAIVSYTVTQRTHEIGIRMALGAARSDVVRAVLKEGVAVVAAGLAVGLVASFGVTRVMSSLLYKVPSNDVVTLAAVSLILSAVSSLASYIPARRATRIEPMVALRHE